MPYPRPQVTSRFYLAAVEKNLHGCKIKSESGLEMRLDMPYCRFLVKMWLFDGKNSLVMKQMHTLKV